MIKPRVRQPQPPIGDVVMGTYDQVRRRLEAAGFVYKPAFNAWLRKDGTETKIESRRGTDLWVAHLDWLNRPR